MTEKVPQLMQVRCVDPDGRFEVIWVEEKGDGLSVVMNVPVYLYGLSLGSIIRCVASKDPLFTFDRVIQNSPGGTVRIIVPGGQMAGEWYLKYLLPAASERQLAVGPATFYDPRMVAVHVQRRSDLWESVGSYLTDLVEQGVIEKWEAGDPETDQDPVIVDRTLRGDDLVPGDDKPTVLVYEQPSSGRREVWIDTS